MKVCEACSTENDDTRVFCLNCGQRLAAPAKGSLPGVPTGFSVGASAPALPTASVRRPLPGKARKLSSTGRGGLLSFLPILLLVALGVAIYLVSQPPASIPAPATADEQATQRMLAFFQKASSAPGGAWMADQHSINQFLSTSVRLQPIANNLGLHADFERCYVELREGGLDFVMQQKIQDYPLYFTLRVQPVVSDGLLSVRFAGASLGRLPVPEFATPLLMALWQPCFDSMESAINILGTAREVRITPKSVVVRWPGKDASAH